MAEILKLIPEADGILFWTGDESVIQANGTSFDDTLKIKEYVIKAVKQGNGEELTPNTRWSWQEIQGKSYLLSVMGILDTYCAVWLEEGILSDLSGQEPGFNLYCRQNERIIMPEGTGKAEMEAWCWSSRLAKEILPCAWQQTAMTLLRPERCTLLFLYVRL